MSNYNLDDSYIININGMNYIIISFFKHIEK